MRRFETTPDVTMEQALQMIRAALDDEGLALGPSATSGDLVTSVITTAGQKTFRVPASRIITREEDASARAAWAKQRREVRGC